MSDPADDRYLFEGSGPPDPEIVRLERALAPLRLHAPPRAAAPSPTVPPAPTGGVLLRWLPFAAAAGLLAAFGLAGLQQSAPEAVEAALRVAADGTVLATGAWIEATDVPREVTIGDVGRVTLDPGARVRLSRAGEDTTSLYLARGRIEARISADARPRFFQVDTPAGRCVDLGCRYTLEVDARGAARVRVMSGQVAFEAGAREVYVPRGASCAAQATTGPGTPRFDDGLGVFTDAVDAVDAAPRGEARRRAARDALALVTQDRDTLAVWHWLTDPDEGVATAALDALVARIGAPAGWTRPRSRPGVADREAFRSLVSARW